MPSGALEKKLCQTGIYSIFSRKGYVSPLNGDTLPQAINNSIHPVVNDSVVYVGCMTIPQGSLRKFPQTETFT